VAEDRDAFRLAMKEIGVPVAEGGIAESVEEAVKLAEGFGLPAIVRASFTLGGLGSGFARTD
jgi:carbamoyl-phosphate synthase large subunit